MTVFPRALPFALFLFAAAVSSQAQVVISEFMASNVNTNIVDEDGNREDWIELQNNGNATVNLNGWYLTDDAADKRKWQFPQTTPAVNLDPGERLLVWASNKNRKLAVDRLHTNFALSSSGEYLALIRPDGLTPEYEFGPKYPPQAADVSYGIAGTKQWTTAVGPTLGSQWKIRTPQSAAEFTTAMAGWHNNISFNDGAWTTVGTGVSASGIPQGIGYTSSGAGGESYYLIYTGSPSGDVQSLMYKPNNATWPGGTAPTLCARIKFNVSIPSQVEQMRLNMRFDDGFVVYLNGTKIFENNAPGSPAWNSAAPIDRQDDQLEDFETFALPLAPGALVAGQNLLTIHAFNEANSGTIGSAVFHMTPQLEVFAGDASGGGTLGYLASATPGGENTTATSAIGPNITETTKNPPQPVGGAGSAPLLVTSRVQPTIKPLSGVTCRYIINFGAEQSVPMRDDGTNGDVTPGDNLYSALLPTTALSPGHFIRWRVVALDNGSPQSQTTDPPYRDSYDNDQYFGTMAQTPTIQSQLPVLYWFNNSGSTFATTKTGFRSALFYKLPTESFGRYYDNVRFNIHGQSTASFNKKSQNVNFNKDNRFLWRAGESEIRSMNLLSNWADKTHVRNSLAWETWNLTGHPSHWAQMVRIQQITSANLNSGVDNQFLCISDMVEDANKEFFERWGLDPDGAMYKMYNDLSNTSQNSSTNGNGVEKKTREWEDFSDLQALVNGLRDTGLSNSLTERRRYLYDNVDVPALINYLAVHNLIQSHDFGHKNYYIYRDTKGTGEWKLLPWDQDLSFGHRWTSAQNYFDDDLESAGGIFIGGGSNWLMRLVNTSGATELTQMYLRRLRTLMDKYYGHPSTPNNHFVSRIDSFLDLIDPSGWPVMTDAEREFQKWGFWVDGSGTAISWTDSRAVHHRIRPSAVRVKSANNTSIYPGANPYSAYGGTTNVHSSMNPFIPGRRAYLYNQIFNATPSVQSLPIPGPQALTPSLSTHQVNFSSAGAPDQDGDFITLRNTSTAESIDLSDWTISGAISFKFPPGTVLPAAGTPTSDGSNSGYVNQIVIAKNAARFRARTSSPTRNQFRFVVSGFSGDLSARGGTFQIKDTTGAVVHTHTYAGSPTDAQQFLRITELNYAPLPPTTAESAALPGIQASDFEFLELINNGASTLSLGNAQFDKGITFAFPAGFTLAPGQRVLIVSNSAAFALRYGSGLNVAGQYEGNLSNQGERLRLLDSEGEVVLDFTYSPAWYPPTGAGGGYSLVTRTTNAPYDEFGNATNWAISGTAGGSPGLANSGFSETFEGWRHDFFSTEETGNPVLTGPLIDFENDGLTNLAEYAFGQNPKQSEVTPVATPGITNIGGADYMTLTFTRRKQALDLIYTVEASTDLESWTPTSLQAGAAVDAAPGLETVTYRDTAPRSNEPRFMRVRAVKP